MPKQKRLLEIAVRKMQPHHKKQWCGALTPSEYLALLLDGAEPSGNYMDSKEYATIRKKRGTDNRMSWFYFYPTGEQIGRSKYPNYLGASK